MSARWSSEELEILANGYGERLTGLQLATKLGRSIGSVQHKASALGIAKGTKYTIGDVYTFCESKPFKCISIVYVNINIPLEFICAICGNSWSTSFNHIKNDNTGCSKCHSKSRSKSFAEVCTYLATARMHCLDTKYTNNTSVLAVRCLVCSHRWGTTFHNVQQGRGCPACANKSKAYRWAGAGTDESAKEIPYSLYIMESDTCIKAGISNNPEKRIRNIRRQSKDPSWEIHTVLDTNLYEAYKLEQAIHSKFKKFPSTHKWPGHTELLYKSSINSILEELVI